MTRKRNTNLRVASSWVVDDFKVIRGIGPLYEKHLHDAGVRTFTQLAKLSPEDVATHIPNLSASQVRKQGWVLQARKLVSKKTEAKPRRKKSTVPTTRQHYENFTVEFLLNDKNKLRRLRVMHVQSGDVETWANWRQEEVTHFLARHTGAGIQERIIQKPEVMIAKSKSAVQETKSVRSIKPKTRHRSSTRKSVKPEIKTQPKTPPRKPKAVSVPSEKKDQVKSTQPKAEQIRISAQKSVKPVVKPPSKKLSQKPESLMVPEVIKDQTNSITRKTKQSHLTTGKLVEPVVNTPPEKITQESEMVSATKEEKVQEEVTQTRTKQNRSKARKSAKPIVKAPPNEISKKPETPLALEVKKGQAKSVRPEGTESHSSAQKPVDKPIVETPPKDISRKSEVPTVPKVEQDQTRSAPLETGQKKQLAPILFRPAAEVLPKKFLQKSNTSPIPEEIKHQADSSQPETPQPQVIRETKRQMGVIRLLQWNNFMADSDQPMQTLPHDQNFDVKLKLDISNVPIATKSQLDITGTLIAKKLGTHERRVIGETQVILPYSPTISLRVGKLALEQGLYRLEAEIKLNAPEAVSLPKGIDTILQGGLFQVY